MRHATAREGLVALLPLLLGASALGGCGAAGGAARADRADAAEARAPVVAGAGPGSPVVVEIFQSQGCSSCPPANANVNAIAGAPGILALSFGVTYWDQLGWRDTFASPAYTARQWDYARHAGRPQVATPQVIVNGATAIVGNDRARLDAAIAAAGPARGGPSISVSGGRVRLSGPTRADASVAWFVRYDPGVREVPVRAGENGGRTLPHRNVVRQLVRLGDWSGGARDFAVPAAREPGLAAAVLVQRGLGGPVTAARKI